MPEVERNVPFCNMVRRITQGTNRGGLRINHILVNFARDGQKDKKYLRCIEEIKKGRTPSEVKAEDPSHQFVELTEELVSRKKGDAMGMLKHLRLEDTREGHLIFLDNRLTPPRPVIDKVLHSLHRSHMSPQTLV